jgi:hypothetical protein
VPSVHDSLRWVSLFVAIWRAKAKSGGEPLVALLSFTRPELVTGLLHRVAHRYIAFALVWPLVFWLREMGDARGLSGYTGFTSPSASSLDLFFY